MSVTYGFYNSHNGDRKYNTEDISSLFDGIIEDGIFMSIGDAFAVEAVNNMIIKVGSGRAWFNSTWTKNDSVLPLTVENASAAVLDRIDAVVLEVDSSEAVRENSIKIITGTAATEPERPALVKTDTVHQYALAYITVAAGVTEITQADITNMIGTEDTPYVIGILKTISVDTLTAQWEDEWNQKIYLYERAYEQWFANMADSYSSWMMMKESDFDELYSETSDECNKLINNVEAQLRGNQTLFEKWFTNLQVKLSEDVAANLQNEIDAVIYQILLDRYQMVNKTTIFNDDGSIIETAADNSYSLSTIFNNDGTITEIFVDSNYVITKTTIFNDNGSITESYIFNTTPVEENNSDS